MIKLTLTDEHLALISNLRMSKLPDNVETLEIAKLGFDLNSLYGGSFVLEDISYILGCYDKHIEGTEEKAMGPEFPKELTDHMFKLHYDIMDNIENIEELVHYYSNKGGLTPGTYVCNEWEHIWSKK